MNLKKYIKAEKLRSLQYRLATPPSSPRFKVSNCELINGGRIIASQEGGPFSFSGPAQVVLVMQETGRSYKYPGLRVRFNLERL